LASCFSCYSTGAHFVCARVDSPCTRAAALLTGRHQLPADMCHVHFAAALPAGCRRTALLGLLPCRGPPAAAGPAAGALHASQHGAAASGLRRHHPVLPGRGALGAGDDQRWRHRGCQDVRAAVPVERTALPHGLAHSGHARAPGGRHPGVVLAVRRQAVWGCAVFGLGPAAAPAGLPGANRHFRNRLLL
jgi:hypothetical protein